jgi:YD repeat-containing protein
LEITILDASYDPQRGLKNETHEIYAYDSLGRLSRITHEHGSGTDTWFPSGRDTFGYSGLNTWNDYHSFWPESYSIYTLDAQGRWDTRLTYDRNDTNGVPYASCKYEYTTHGNLHKFKWLSHPNSTSLLDTWFFHYEEYVDTPKIPQTVVPKAAIILIR